MTLAALEAIASLRSRTFAVDLVVGNDNPRRDELERRCAALADVKLHVQPPGMAALFAQATLALGAAGSTSWERCCLGLPTVLVSIADNQKSGAAALGFARAAIDLGSMSAVPGRLLASMLETLIRRPRLLRYMGLRASMLVDGKGTERIAEMMECA
jgi:UDP-2,4-diacetamido-2,4,6-trideoxy-beta-L-altropyranose hydrolase